MHIDLTALPLWYVAFLFSLTCHEAAHALAAKLGGDMTAFHGGQVTLNPAPHIQREPVGTVLVPLISYLVGGWMIGWASAPYDPFWQRRYPHRAAWMALAGPAANFTIVIIVGLLIHLGISLGALAIPDYAGFTHIVAPTAHGFWVGVATFLSILFSLNLLLGLFNLIPLPPLDGNTAVGLFMSEESALRFAEFSHNPQFAFIGLLISWKVMDVIFPPVFRAALGLLYPWAGF